MKKTILFASIIILTSTFTYAQFPDKGSKGFTFGVNGISGLNLNVSHNGTLMYKYFISDDLVMRYSATINVSNNGITSTNFGRESDNFSNNYSAGLGIGCEKIFAKLNRFALYAGADLIPTLSGGSSTIENKIVDASQAGGLNGDFNKTVTTRPTLFSIGLYPCLGFEYFISKNFSIGGEFSFSGVYSLPGKTTSTTSSQTNGIAGKQTSTSSTQIAQFNITGTSGAFITGSIYF